MSEPDAGRYGLVVRFDVADGHEEAFDGLVTDTLAAIRSSEPGTLAYMVHRESGSPNIRVFYELYQDEAAFQAHESMPHVRRFLIERAQHLSRDPEVTRVTPIGGVVLPEVEPPGG